MADMAAAQNSKNEPRIAFPQPKADMAAQCLPDKHSPGQRSPDQCLPDLHLLDKDASKDELIESAVKCVLQEIKVAYPEDFSALDQSEKSELAQITREVMKEQVYLNSIPNIEDPDELAKHLPAERIKVIQRGLEIPTYELKFNRVDHHTYVNFTREGRPIDMETIEIRSRDDINWTKVYQYSSIAVEGVYLILSISDIAFSIEDEDIKEVTQKTNKVVRESEILIAEIENLKNVWDDEDSGLRDKAVAIFGMIKALRKERILWKIVKHLVKCADSATTLEWLKLLVKAIAVVLSSIVTSGSSFISEIISAIKAVLDPAGRFLDKIKFLNELDEITPPEPTE